MYWNTGLLPSAVLASLAFPVTATSNLTGAGPSVVFRSSPLVDRFDDGKFDWVNSSPILDEIDAKPLELVSSRVAVVTVPPASPSSFVQTRREFGVASRYVPKNTIVDLL